MLVLSRKKNETIIIDGRIKVEVLKIKGNTIRLGISAPREVKVLRGEISPFEVDVTVNAESTNEEADHTAPHNAVAEQSSSYSADPMVSVPFTLDADDLRALPNPFAVVTG